MAKIISWQRPGSKRQAGQRVDGRAGPSGRWAGSGHQDFGRAQAHQFGAQGGQHVRRHFQLGGGKFAGGDVDIGYPGVIFQPGTMQAR